MGTEDEFMEIINNNNLQDFMSNSEIHHMTIKDMHIGVRDLSEALLYITDFIHNFFSFISENSEEDSRPSLSVESITHAKLMFESAGKFCDSIVAATIESIEFEEEDEDDDKDG